MPTGKTLVGSLVIGISAAMIALGTASATPRTSAAGETQVLICHHAGPTKTIEITVDAHAVPAHIANHGDTVGACGGSPS